MTAAFWSIDWTNKFRQMDLSEVMQVLAAAEYVKREKQSEALKK